MNIRDDQTPSRSGTLISRPGVRQDDARQRQSGSATTGASAAGIRAVATQFMAFYFRAPAKAFFRTRLDYTAYARAINPQVQAGAGWSWRTSSPVLLAWAVRKHGWDFIPNQVLPPMLANVTVGAVLYTSYLQFLGALHEPSAQAAKRTFPPPDPRHTFAAGFAAGSIQSLVAAPLDALQVRFKTSEMLEGRYRHMWHYAHDKLRAIGPQGIFAGWGLTLLRDSFGSALFFSTFEYIKAQMYYGFLTRYYTFSTSKQPFRSLVAGPNEFKGEFDEGHRPTLKPHYMIEPTFLLTAGISATFAQQVVQYPLTSIQNIHSGRLESIDYAARIENRQQSIFRLYYKAYEHTLKQCEGHARRAGGWFKWLYRGYLWNTIRQTPSTSAGLIVFEIVRRKYADSTDVIRIQKDGYDILLT